MCMIQHNWALEVELEVREIDLPPSSSIQVLVILSRDVTGLTCKTSLSSSYLSPINPPESIN